MASLLPHCRSRPEAAARAATSTSQDPLLAVLPVRMPAMPAPGEKTSRSPDPEAMPDQASGTGTPHLPRAAALAHAAGTGRLLMRAVAGALHCQAGDDSGPCQAGTGGAPGAGQPDGAAPASPATAYR